MWEASCLPVPRPGSPTRTFTALFASVGGNNGNIQPKEKNVMEGRFTQELAQLKAVIVPIDEMKEIGKRFDEIGEISYALESLGKVLEFMDDCTVHDTDQWVLDFAEPQRTRNGITTAIKFLAGLNYDLREKAIARLDRCIKATAAGRVEA